jgi:hypothetical protein
MNIVSIVKQVLPTIKNAVCIYIGVGTAAHMVREINGKKELEDLYYHQYPKCLEEMNQSTDITIFHILIDTVMESPPFMTIDKSKGLDFIQVDNMYYSKCNKHIVYPLKMTVTMDCYNNNYHPEWINITEELRELNQLAINENLLLIYNDFSGRSNKTLANYFDESISKNLDHIIYGLGSRGDHGCYIDLLNPECKFAFISIDSFDRKSIKVFNIYDIVKNKKNLLYEIDMYSLEHLEIITASIEVILKHTYNHFNNNVFFRLRILYQLMTNKTKLEDFNEYIIENIFNDIISKSELDELFKIKDYTTCFNIVCDIESSQLDVIIYLKDLNTNCKNLMDYITGGGHEYKWGDVLKNIIYS